MTIRLIERDLVFSTQNDPTAPDLAALLGRSAGRHSRLCPRPVLGARMGLYGLQLLGLSGQNRAKRMLVIVETDGCFAEGIEEVTGCTIGQRTLRIEDYGKVAATFVSLLTDEALRLAPQPGIRDQAAHYTARPQNRYQAQLEGYQVMPADELFSVQKVQLRQPLHTIIGVPDRRVNCSGCGEEIINQRETQAGARFYCQTCIGGGYYAAE